MLADRGQLAGSPPVTREAIARNPSRRLTTLEDSG